MTLPLLTVDTVESYLRTRGVLHDSATEVVELGGGVSNVVLSVETATDSLIVKQSLPRLKVSEEWLAPVTRIITEARGLETSLRTVKNSAPPVIDSDPDRFVLTMQRSPVDWSDWKSTLLRGTIDASVAATVGNMLGKLHSRTTDASQLDASLLTTEPFEQLRLSPYYRFTASRVPEFAEVLTSMADDLGGTRICLVHGDFSPKNILVGPSEPPDGAAPVWFIDFEVAHFGDPSFDLAFMLTHLVLKSLHAPDRALRFDAAANSFVASYQRAVAPPITPNWARVVRHVGALLLARVHGKSPAEYLDDHTKAQAHSIAATILSSSSDLDLPFIHRRRDEVIQ